MDLSIIIVSWNVKDLLRENLKAIYSNTQNLDFEVIVVDNNSADDTIVMVKTEFEQVTLINNSENKGFAAGNNQGIKIAKGDYILLLNPDMRVNNNTLSGMIAWMRKHDDVGVATCKLLKADGTIIPHVRRYPTVWDQSAIVLKIAHLFPKLLDKYLWRDFDYSKEAEVDSVRGSFFMMPCEVVQKLGGLDERYFIWFEEVDFCRQVKQAGYKVMYTPVVECIDYVGKSFSQVQRYKTQMMFTDSMLKYFKKWHLGWQSAWIQMIRPIGLASAWVAEKIGMKRNEGKIKN